MIIQIDIDYFYAQVEQVMNKDLIGMPVGVKQKGIIVTCNYEARNKGVGKLQILSEALKICPDLIVLDGSDISKYRLLSLKLFRLLKEWFGSTVPIERLGFDEFFIDVTELITVHLKSRKIWPDGTIQFEVLNFKNIPNHPPVGSFTYKLGTVNGEMIGEYDEKLGIVSHLTSYLRTCILKCTGLTCSAGISYCKLYSKLAASKHKPNQQTIFSYGPDIDVELDNTPICKIPGIGHKTLQTIQQHIESINPKSTCSEARTMISINHWCNILQLDRSLYELICGIDTSPVKMTLPTQQISVQDTFKAITDWNFALCQLQKLLERLVDRYHNEELPYDGRVPSTLKITIKSNTMVTRSFQIPKRFFEKGTKEWYIKTIESQIKFKEPRITMMNVSLLNFEITTKKRRSEIDPQVFASLPLSIQQEILQEQGRKKKARFSFDSWKKNKQDI